MSFFGRESIITTMKFMFQRAILRIHSLDPKQYEFSLATTREDLEQAFALLHDERVARGVCAANPSGLAVTFYEALPFTSVLTVKMNGKIIGMAILCKDSPVGVPSDRLFLLENNFIRAQGHKLGEISAWAFRPDFRRDRNIFLHFFCFAWRYATAYMDISQLVSTVLADKSGLLIACLGFRISGKVWMSQDCMVFRSYLKKIFGRAPEHRNLEKFWAIEPECFVFPKRLHASVVDPVMTAELLDYFFRQKTDIFKQLSKKELALIKSAYQIAFNLDDTQHFRAVPPNLMRSFRYPSRIIGAISTGKEGSTQGSQVTFLGKIFDLSAEGLFFETREILDMTRDYEVSFIVLGESVRVRATPCWHNGEISVRHPKGYGFKFEADEVVLRLLEQVHVNSQSITLNH